MIDLREIWETQKGLWEMQRALHEQLGQLVEEQRALVRIVQGEFWRSHREP